MHSGNEDAEILSQQRTGEWLVLRLKATSLANAVSPGTSIELRSGTGHTLTAPVMRANAQSGTVDVLYRGDTPGLEHFAEKRPGERLTITGPIGKSFVRSDKTRTVLIGEDLGIASILFLSSMLHEGDDRAPKPLVLLGTNSTFPFRTRPSTILLPDIPEGVIACMPMLDEWGVPSRLATKSDFPGCFDGFVTQLGDAWLDSLGPEQLAEVEIFACGPTPMLKSTAALARKHNVACQVSLEEFMACAVGGCAGCTVLVQTDDGPAMKRVCVDGPVFDAYRVFAAATIYQ